MDLCTVLRDWQQTLCKKSCAIQRNAPCEMPSLLATSVDTKDPRRTSVRFQSAVQEKVGLHIMLTSSLEKLRQKQAQPFFKEPKACLPAIKPQARKSFRAFSVMPCYERSGL